MPVLGVRLPWWLSFTSTAVLVLATLGVIVPGVIRHRSEEMKVTPCGRSHQDDVFKPQGYHSHLKVAGVPDGCECHFELSGDTKGELVVLMHGITASSAILRGVARELETLGFRVLNFDFFGRGHSSACLERRHDETLFTEQMQALLDTLHHSKRITDAQHRKFHIVGYSMGGGVAMVYAGNHPEKVRSLYLFAPAGIPFSVPLITNLMYIPGLLTVLETSPYWAQVLLDSRVTSDLEPRTAQVYRWVNFHHASKPDFWRSFVDALYHFPLTNLTASYTTVGKTTIPTKFFWGTGDRTVPHSCLKHALELVPHAEVELAEGAGHLAIMEREEQTHPSIVKFFSALRDEPAGS